MKIDKETVNRDKPEIKAIFFDVDQTLLSHRQKRIPPGTLRALWQLKEKGIRVAVSTGRHLQELEVLDQDSFPYDGYTIMNGQMCLDKGRQPFFEMPIKGRSREALLNLYHSKDFPVILVGRHQMYINYMDETVRKVAKTVPAQRPVTEAFDGGDLFMGCIFCPGDRDRSIEADLEGLCLTRWNEYAADIIPRGDGKVQGIRQFLQRWNLAPEEVMAFGDEENDLGMLSFAGVGVAMGNARETVKLAADYVTQDVDEDGVREALLHFGLIADA